MITWRVVHWLPPADHQVYRGGHWVEKSVGLGAAAQISVGEAFYSSTASRFQGTSDLVPGDLIELVTVRLLA